MVLNTELGIKSDTDIHIKNVFNYVGKDKDTVRSLQWQKDFNSLPSEVKTMRLHNYFNEQYIDASISRDKILQSTYKILTELTDELTHMFGQFVVVNYKKPKVVEHDHYVEALLDKVSSIKDNEEFLYQVPFSV